MVKDADGNRQQQTITIDAPTVAVKKTGSFTDTRDGTTYKWVRMNDGKKWMAENLNKTTTNSWCFDNDEKNCKKYGRLYTWDDAMAACPKGWRLPSDEEWWKITSRYGKIYSKERGNTDKKAGLNIYEHFSKNGDTGFSIQLGSFRRSNEKFAASELGKSGSYWSSTEKSNKATTYSFSRSGHISDMNLSHVGTGFSDKKNGFSCRCIQD